MTPVLRRIAFFAALSLLLAGCGVRFRDPDPGTEFFSDIDVSGEMRAGAPLTVLVSYEQTYGVEVELACELRRNRQTLSEIGRTIVPAHPDGKPEATPVIGSLAYDFTVEQPGAYKVECLTPKDEDNYIAEDLTIGE
jgi:hypothetical protein